VADEGVSNGDVEASGRELELVNVADGEPDTVGDAVADGEPVGDGDELRALIYTRHGAGESVARGDRPGHDARAAAEVQHCCRARQVDQVEVGIAVGDERRILTAKLEPFDEPFECRCILQVDELHRVVNLCRHPRSSSSPT
jgi:hypothetical protein